MNKAKSWNNFPKVKNQEIVSLDGDFTFNDLQKNYLAYGNGRSYGDICLNEGGTLVDTKKYSKILNFNEVDGVITCESGITFDEILNFISKKNWFLPVVPGTRYITLGGAIANDIHGKNHHNAGSFGNYVNKFELLRSNNEKYICSENENSDYFYATIGGMGLTGIITWAEIKLKKINSEFLKTQTLRFNSLDEYIDLNVDLEKKWDYTVAWFDLSLSKKDIRGVFHSGNHLENNIEKKHRNLSVAVPFTPPISLVNNFTSSIINEAYYRINKEEKDKIQHYKPFFFPLDGIKSWNRVYGTKGFFQYQFVVPPGESKKALSKVFDAIRLSNQKPFLGVLKTFGSMPPKGLMSFPREGTTLAIDFPNKGKKTINLFDQLDEIVISHKGSIYPAKDSRMSKNVFESSFENKNNFKNYIDEKISSSFWKRVN